MTASTTATATHDATTNERKVPQFDRSELMCHFSQLVVDHMDTGDLMASVKAAKEQQLTEMSIGELLEEIEGHDYEDEELQKMLLQFHNTVFEETEKAYEEITSMTANSGDVVKLNAPAWFEYPDFIAAIESPGVMTWHKAGQPVGEYSDVVLFVDPSLNGEGAEDGTCPEPIWQAIIAACKHLVGEKKGVDQVMVRITNLQE